MRALVGRFVELFTTAPRVVCAGCDCQSTCSLEWGIQCIANLNEWILLNLDDEGVQQVVEALPRGKNLRGALLDYMGVRLECARALAKAAAANASIGRLNLGMRHVEGEWIAAVVEILSSSKTLKYVGLSGNDIGDAGAVALAEALTKNENTWEVLNLGWNEVGDVGAVALAEAIAKHKTLTTLHLRSNSKITERGREALVRSMHRSWTLARVWMDYNFELRLTTFEAECRRVRLEVLPFVAYDHRRGDARTKFLRADGDHAVGVRVLRFLMLSDSTNG